MIYIFIVDDHPLFIDGVSSAFIKDIDNIEVVGSANSGKEAIEKLKDSKADVVLLDLVMPEKPQKSPAVCKLRPKWRKRSLQG